MIFTKGSKEADRGGSIETIKTKMRGANDTTRMLECKKFLQSTRKIE